MRLGQLPKDRDLLLVGLLNRTLRVVVPVLPYLVPRHRRERARAQVRQLQEMFREQDAIQRQMDECPLDQALTRGLDLTDQVVDKYGSAEDREQQRLLRARIRQIEADGTAVQELATQHQGNPDALIEALRHYLAEAPEHSVAHRRLVQELAARGDLEEALHLQRERVRVTEAEPAHAPMARLLLAKLLDQNQEKDAATEEVRRLLKDFPNGILEHLEGGDLLLTAGDQAGAERAWKRAAWLGRGTLLATEARRRLKESRSRRQRR